MKLSETERALVAGALLVTSKRYQADSHLIENDEALPVEVRTYHAGKLHEQAELCLKLAEAFAAATDVEVR